MGGGRAKAHPYNPVLGGCKPDRAILSCDQHEHAAPSFEIICGRSMLRPYSVFVG
jgi:hypothetical protein